MVPSTDSDAVASPVVGASTHRTTRRARRQYASPSLYAKSSCSAADPCYLLRLLHGRHRIACRLLIILLSQQGMAASQIADLLSYVPSTVRRGIHRYQRHGASGLADRPRFAMTPQKVKPVMRCHPVHGPASGLRTQP